MVAIINQNNIRRNSINDNFGRFSQNSSSERDISLWTRETWYTPHRNEGKSSVIPSHLFGLRLPASFLEKLLLLPSDNEADNANSSVSEDNGDAYGFIKLNQDGTTSTQRRYMKTTLCMISKYQKKLSHIFILFFQL